MSSSRSLNILTLFALLTLQTVFGADPLYHFCSDTGMTRSGHHSSGRGRGRNSEDPTPSGNQGNQEREESPPPELNEEEEAAGSQAKVPPRRRLGPDGRIQITVLNRRIHPSEDASRAMCKIFEQRLDAEGWSWKTVSPSTKDVYWEEFKKQFVWDEAITALLKKAWEMKSRVRYADKLTKLKAKGKIPPYVDQNVWDEWTAHWEGESSKKKSEQTSKNRFGKSGQPSKHTGGTISYATHHDRMGALLRRSPTPSELFCRTHTRGNDEVTFIDDRSRAVNVYLYNVNAVSDPAYFNGKTKELLGKLAGEAVGTSKLYASGEMELTGSRTLYGLTQCTRDLSSEKCKTCLDEIISELPNCCDGKEGGRVIGGSCNFIYEIYPFVNS